MVRSAAVTRRQPRHDVRETNRYAESVLRNGALAWDSRGHGRPALLYRPSIWKGRTNGHRSLPACSSLHREDPAGALGQLSSPDHALVTERTPNILRQSANLQEEKKLLRSDLDGASSHWAPERSACRSARTS